MGDVLSGEFKKTPLNVNVSNAFDRSNAEWAKPKPLYKQKESKSTRRKSLYSYSLFSVDIFTFVKYVHER